MASDHRDVDRIVEDLHFLRQAVSKNSNVLRFMALSRILGTVSLAGGILITVFAGAYLLLIKHYGAYDLIPAGTKNLMTLLIAASFLLTAVYKVWGILAGARRVRSDLTLSRLLREVYTSRFLLILLPFLVAMGGIIGFLIVHELTLYLVPALAVLVGLLCNSLVDLFHIREFMIGGDWLIATGIIALFAAKRLDPLMMLILTFGLGFILIFAASRIMAKAEGKPADG